LGDFFLYRCLFSVLPLFGIRINQNYSAILLKTEKECSTGFFLAEGGLFSGEQNYLQIIFKLLCYLLAGAKAIALFLFSRNTGVV